MSRTPTPSYTPDTSCQTMNRLAHSMHTEGTYHESRHSSLATHMAFVAARIESFFDEVRRRA